MAAAPAHFHACIRNAPFMAVHIEFVPCSMTQFAWPDERIGQQHERMADGMMSMIGHDGVQHAADCGRVEECRHMPGRRLTDGATERWCRVAFAAAGSDGVTQDLADQRAAPMCRCRRSARIDMLQYAKDVRCADLRHRNIAESRQDMLSQT